MDEIGKIKQSIQNIAGRTSVPVFAVMIKSVEGEKCIILAIFIYGDKILFILRRGSNIK